MQSLVVPNRGLGPSPQGDTETHLIHSQYGTIVIESAKRQPSTKLVSVSWTLCAVDQFARCFFHYQVVVETFCLVGLGFSLAKPAVV